MIGIARKIQLPLFAAACFALSAGSAVADEPECFCIKVVDEATGRGVPLVELKTVNNISLFTDSAGVAAFYEPGLMNQTVYFSIDSHGYEYPKDGFGYRGARLDVKPGGEATLKIRRVNIAQRLYRVTGAGIYRDSMLLGKPAPIREPVLNGQVLGSDSVVNAVHNGKIYWFWGDTNRTSYPLGNFHVSGAVSELPGKGGLDPEVGVDLRYFVNDDGFAKETARMPGQGPTWLTALATLKEKGRQRLFAAYAKIEPPLEVYERGLAVFDEQKRQFDKLVEFDSAPLSPEGHPFNHREDGVDYLYFANPFPVVRVRATASHLKDSAKYEAYTCLKKGSRADTIELETQDGVPQYGWKADTIPFTPKLQAKLIEEGLLRPKHALYRLVDEEGKRVVIHRGSVCWNDYRKRWIMIGVELLGASALGEVWYAEAERPTGPWSGAKKIVTHDRYSFYNPKQHPMFDKDGGRVIFFEGTYTHTFSGNDEPTPRYDYNQIMYKLDLSDPRLR